MNRRNNFDALRLFLAVLVILSHSYLLTNNSPSEPMAWLSRTPYSLGFFAVEGFFCISGFLIAQSWMNNPDFWSYLKKRVLRIYPGFAVASLFCFIIVGPLGADSVSTYLGQLSWPHFLLRVALLQGLHLPLTFVEQPHSRAINGSLWSIPYEFLCYLLIPVAAYLGLLKRRAALAVLFVASYIYFLITFQPLIEGNGLLLISPAMAMKQSMFFLSGMVVYFFRDKFTFNAKWACAYGAVFLAAVFLGFPALVSPLLVAPMLVSLAFSPEIKLHHAAKYGDFSYGVYLYAYPIEQLIVRWSHNAVTPLPLFFLAVPFAFGAAWCSWHLVEHRCLLLKPSTRPAAR